MMKDPFELPLAHPHDEEFPFVRVGHALVNLNRYDSFVIVENSSADGSACYSVCGLQKQTQIQILYYEASTGVTEEEALRSAIAGLDAIHQAANEWNDRKKWAI